MAKLQNYDKFKNTFPYQSEMFGIYQPLIGWKSKRKASRLVDRDPLPLLARFEQLAKYFDSRSSFEPSDYAECSIGSLKLELGEFKESIANNNEGSVLLQTLSNLFKGKHPKDSDEWKAFFEENDIKKLLVDIVSPYYQREFQQRCRTLNLRDIKTGEIAKTELEAWIKERLQFESKIGRILYELLNGNMVELLNGLFSLNHDELKTTFEKELKEILNSQVYIDPYLTFDPQNDIKNVSVSPLGIVHLFRQFFFEFDTFLGSPTGHVWMAPGSTVELIETSQRKTITEKYYETNYESTTKSETSTTDQDEISEAVKKDNKDDLKLGFSTTVNQSWGTGNASATASINMDKTQQVARETTHKKMREQTQKLSAEIRENYKSTFRTVTEITDTSSKRYVLANNTGELINYELRRKMRQVGVQVQDIGSYLCWETFVDDPGSAIGLSNLLHIASPADLVPVDDTKVVYPPDKFVPFTVNIVWDFGKNRQYNEPHSDVGGEFVPMTTYQIPATEEGYELEINGYAKKIPGGQLNYIPLTQVSAQGKNFHGVWAFTGMLTDNNQQLKCGVSTTPIKGLGWSDRVDFVVGGVLKFVPTAAKRAEIDTVNIAKQEALTAATVANLRTTQDTYLKAVKDRVELASNITKRKYEDLREEERIIVYRFLIEELMKSQYIEDNDPNAENRNRHVMSELLNSIFDIDKMLYFVAPEWWHPRKVANFVGVNQLTIMQSDVLVGWGDNEARDHNYLITEKSQPAAMGSSLGWLLQLDGDNLRNAFLNAPWVKAVIPIRPGKEQAATAWLQHAGVEGSEGLEFEYSAPQDELDEIRTGLLADNSDDPVNNHERVTIGDAIRFLCIKVSQKHTESNKPDQFPKGTEINEVDQVSATPVDKVYEYGFYPLQGSFKYDPADPDPTNPDRNFQVFDQWLEILPTDQIVPVEVKYDPKSGKQI